jgi:hypothetical protein
LPARQPRRERLFQLRERGAPRRHWRDSPFTLPVEPFAVPQTKKSVGDRSGPLSEVVSDAAHAAAVLEVRQRLQQELIFAEEIEHRHDETTAARAARGRAREAKLVNGTPTRGGGCG